MAILVPPPIEKLPIFVLGSVLALVGAFLAVQETMFSWQQLKAVAMIAAGVGATFYDVRRRARKAKQAKGEDGDSN
ncbi:hypothetical protein [Roseateles saccharophilus]|uniref:Uncharacterized protein n=1 Tax=Roseateles saccharophilus TaxID=304 RepID=A0A4R3UD45_ROSSA|nr:hypothetical protein [Roseateles saccharophilus]MDG0835247.1 hypothetical protein [Roseateles saccharophilus]TCU86861.1 hypothetical protein EV671_104515 [Roseateles saccharophilus]